MERGCRWGRRTKQDARRRKRFQEFGGISSAPAAKDDGGSFSRMSERTNHDPHQAL